MGWLGGLGIMYIILYEFTLNYQNTDLGFMINSDLGWVFSALT